MTAIQNRKEALALIHVARKDLGLDEEAYRALLSGAAGIESSADIETREQFDAIMRSFSVLGFKRKPSANKKFISRRQIYYIKSLWELASRSKSEEGLKKLIARIGHVDDIRFLDKKAAKAVILTMKDICRKAGFDPDRKGGLS